MKRTADRMIISGFVLAFVSIMLRLATLSTPIIDGYQHAAWWSLGPLAALGIGLIAVGKWKGAGTGNLLLALLRKSGHVVAGLE
jgi:hypothetical protein